MENIATHLLSQGSFWLLNKALYAKMGRTKAYCLTDLLDKHQYYSVTKRLVDGEWFFYRREDMAKLWEMQWALQRKILEEFESLGLVATKKIGLKNYYRIDIPTFEVFMQTCIKEYNEELSNKYKKQGLED